MVFRSFYSHLTCIKQLTISPCVLLHCMFYIDRRFGFVLLRFPLLHIILLATMIRILNIVCNKNNRFSFVWLHGRHSISRVHVALSVIDDIVVIVVSSICILYHHIVCMSYHHIERFYRSFGLSNTRLMKPFEPYY